MVWWSEQWVFGGGDMVARLRRGLIDLAGEGLGHSRSLGWGCSTGEGGLGVSGAKRSAEVGGRL